MSVDSAIEATKHRWLECLSCGWKTEPGEYTSESIVDCCPKKDIHVMSPLHNWARVWPGNFCLDCGLDNLDNPMPPCPGRLPPPRSTP